MLECARMAETEHEYKMRFARSLQQINADQRNAMAVVAVKDVVGKENAAQYPIYVIECAEKWQHDPEVIAEIERLDAILPCREVYLRQIWNEATEKYSEKRDRILALRLYGESNGWTQRTSKEGTNQNELLGHLQALHNAVTNPEET